jgi:transposase-like protein
LRGSSQTRVSVAVMLHESVSTTQTTCYHCGSHRLIKHGIAPNGKQKYKCKSCGKQSRDHPSRNGYTEERREEILLAAQFLSSRTLSREFGVARNTIMNWRKKVRSPDLQGATFEYEPESGSSQ